MSAPRGAGVPRLLHLQQGPERQRRLLRHRLGQPRSRAGTTWTAPTRSGTTDRSPTDVRHNFTLAGTYELPFGKGRKNGRRLERVEERRPRRTGTSTRSSRSRTGFADHRLRRRRAVAAGAPDRRAAERRLRRQHERERPRRHLGRHQLLPARAGRAVRELRGRHPAGPGYWNVDLGISKNFYLDDRKYLHVPGRGLQRVQPPELRGAPRPREHRRPGRASGRSTAPFSAPRIIELVLKFVY